MAEAPPLPLPVPLPTLPTNLQIIGSNDISDVGNGGGDSGDEDDNGGDVDGMDQTAKKEEEGAAARTTIADKRQEWMRGRGVNETTSR